MSGERVPPEEELTRTLLRRSDGPMTVRPFRPVPPSRSVVPVAAVVAAVLVLAVVAGTQLAAYRQRAATAPASPSPDSAALASGSSAPSPSGAPVVDINAFSGLGVLAFDWHDGLWLLDGTNRSMTRIDEAGGALSWSPSGEWLTYTKPRGGLVDVWLVRADGSAARRISGLPDATNAHLRWSPVADVLAVGIFAASGESGVWIASPSEPARPVIRGDAGFIWSADGATLIYSTVLPFTRPEDRDDALWSVAITGGTPRQWWIARRAGIVLQSALPDGQGVLLFQAPGHSSSVLADGVPLEVFRFGDAAPRPLPVVAKGSPQWLPDGRSVLLLAGQGRFMWNNKTLARCDVIALACSSVAADRSAVAMEPALSADGSKVAFVRAPERGFTGFSDQSAIDAWNAQRRLWVGPLSSPREIAGLGQAVFAPDWAPDAKHLLFIRDDTAWLTDDQGSAPRKLVAELGLTAQPWSFYWPHAWSRSPAQARHPVGWTLPTGCSVATGPVASGRRTLWTVDCGATANARAAATFGDSLTAQGWTACGGSGSPTWLKGDYALTVTDGSTISGNYIGLTQSPREIVSCR